MQQKISLPLGGFSFVKYRVEYSDMEVDNDLGIISPEMKDSLEYKHMLEFLKEDNIPGAYSCLRRIQDVEGETYKEAYEILSEAIK